MADSDGLSFFSSVFREKIPFHLKSKNTNDLTRQKNKQLFSQVRYFFHQLKWTVPSSHTASLYTGCIQAVCKATRSRISEDRVQRPQLKLCHQSASFKLGAMQISLSTENILWHVECFFNWKLISAMIPQRHEGFLCAHHMTALLIIFMAVKIFPFITANTFVAPNLNDLTDVTSNPSPKMWHHFNRAFLFDYLKKITLRFAEENCWQVKMIFKRITLKSKRLTTLQNVAGGEIGHTNVHNVSLYCSKFL